MGNSVWLTINGLIVISTWIIIVAVLALALVLFMTKPFPKIRSRPPVNSENNLNIHSQQNMDSRSDDGGDESSFRTGTILKQQQEQPSDMRVTSYQSNSTQLCEDNDEPTEISTLLDISAGGTANVNENDYNNPHSKNDKGSDDVSNLTPIRTSSSASPFSRLSPRLNMITPSSLRQSFSSSINTGTSAASNNNNNNNNSASFMRRLSTPSSSSSSKSNNNNSAITTTNDYKPSTPAQKHLEDLLANDLSLVLHTEDGASRSVILSLNHYQLQYMSKALLSSRRTGFIDLTQVLTITAGKNTNVFHYSSSAAIAAEPNCCFSLISDQSTFDIEVTSVSERDALVAAISTVHQEAIASIMDAAEC